MKHKKIRRFEENSYSINPVPVQNEPDPIPSRSGSVSTPALPKVRLASLDALRGLDLFLLVGLAKIYPTLTALLNRFFSKTDIWGKLNDQFCSHSDWTGFTVHDLIMPLFIFMSGATICFSMAKYRRSEENPNPSRTRFWLRFTRRILLLWIFGMIAQGNLLALKWEGLRLYSNTLQAIAAGYMIATACYFFLNKKWTAVAAVLLMAAFWGVMLIGHHGYVKWDNMAEVIDRKVLGRWMDGVTFGTGGEWSFNQNYHYTWILSSLTFGVTAISGLLGGQIIKTRRDAEKSGHLTSLILIAIGGAAAAAGWFWGKVPENMIWCCPLIKHLWTPSMVLFSSGICYMLLGLFHEVYDVLRLPLLKTFFAVIGMNSILVYMLPNFVDFPGIARNFVWGLEHHIGNWYPPLVAILGFTFTWFFLYALYKSKTFLRL